MKKNKGHKKLLVERNEMLQKLKTSSLPIDEKVQLFKDIRSKKAEIADKIGKK